MEILVHPQVSAKNSSCNYTCPVYNTGVKGIKKMMRKLNKKKKNQSAWKVCWYNN